MDPADQVRLADAEHLAAVQQLLLRVVVAERLAAEPLFGGHRRLQDRAHGPVEDHDPRGQRVFEQRPTVSDALGFHLNHSTSWLRGRFASPRPPRGF